MNLQQGPHASRLTALRNGVRGAALPLPPLACSIHAPWDGLAMEVHRLPPMDMEEFSFEQHMLMLARPETPRDAGEMEFRVDGKPIRTHFSGEQLCLIGAGHQLAGRKPFHARGLAVGLDPAVLQQAADEMSVDPRLVEIETKPQADDPQIVHILKTLEGEMTAGYPGGKMFGDALRTALAIQLLKAHTVRRAEPQPRKGGLAPRTLRRVLEFIDAHLSEDPSLDALAAVAGLSAFHFARMFKDSTGKSPHQYVLHRRVERAKERLHGTRTSLSALSAELGFSHQSHFTNVFRRLVGATPGAYRRALA